MSSTATPATIVRGFSLQSAQDTIVRNYARRRCGGNTSLALRTMIDHFAACPEATNAEPTLDPSARPTQEQPA